MQSIPPAKSSDAEDVVWGLQTADALWKRGERNDALVWLRRAAQAAGDASDDDRALELARFAAELADLVASEPPPRGPLDTNADMEPPPAEVPTYVPGATEPVSIEVEVEPEQGARPPPPRHHEASQPTMQTAEPAFPEPTPATAPPEEGRPSATSVLPAERVHAGMFNPWDEGAPQPAVPAPSPLPNFAPEEDEVITSVRPLPMPPEHIVVPDVPIAPPLAKPASPAKPPRPPPLPARARAPKPPVPPSPRDPAHATEAPPTPRVDMEAALAAADELPTEPPPPIGAPPIDVAPPPPVSEPPVAVPSFPVGAPEIVAAGAASGALDLSSVDAFADLPDEARAAFAAAAKIDDLAEGEEVSSFALAYVLEGAFDVAATMVDAPALRLEAGAVLRARGTTQEGVPMRLIGAAPKGRVATWSGEDVEAAFRTIPWVEDDLRAAADRAMTLVGITIGPLGERLDVAIREAIVGKLTMRPLAPGEVVVQAGQAVPGLFLVGVGEIELVKDGEVVAGTVGSGDFLFASEVLGAGPAPATARAGAGGALILYGDLGVAQELLVTCPPLLEVFAGM